MSKFSENYWDNRYKNNEIGWGHELGQITIKPSLEQILL